jgi:ankyrin repeat protein
MEFLNLFRKKAVSSAHSGAPSSNSEVLGAELIDACLEGDVARAADLLKRGANPNYARESMFGAENCLYFAIGRPALLKLLLSSGADPNHRAGDRDLLLEFACAEGIDELATFLLEHGATLHTRDKDGWTPLMFACGNAPNATLVSKLLRMGSDPNECDNDGWSALMNAAKTGDNNVVTLLIRAGAKANSIDKDGNTPARVALQFGHSQTAGLLTAKAR